MHSKLKLWKTLSICKLFILTIVTLPGCEQEIIPVCTLCGGQEGTINVIEQLGKYPLLPEKALAITPDSLTFAQYTLPVTRYAHGILGDAIEAGQLVVAHKGLIYEYTLPQEYVYEDIRPRLVDVTGDSIPEIFTIRTHVAKGAGIAIYQLQNGQLVEYATVPEIGIPSRWLNIAAIYDLDGDGTLNLAWIQTPHIGGILKVCPIQAGRLSSTDQVSTYSNHAIGDRNLCLSVITKSASETLLYVPNQSRNKVSGFALVSGKWVSGDEIPLSVDFSKPLHTQYAFSKAVAMSEMHCYHP